MNKEDKNQISDIVNEVTAQAEALDKQNHTCDIYQFGLRIAEKIAAWKRQQTERKACSAFCYTVCPKSRIISCTEKNCSMYMNFKRALKDE